MGKACRLFAGWHLFLGFMLFLLAWVVTGCGGSPTAPELPEAPSPVVSRYSWRTSGATEGEAAQVVPLWVDVSACVGVPTLLSYDSFVTVEPGSFLCGGVDAAGCFRPPAAIVAARPWFHEALQHEMVHFALWRKGGDWGNHEDPAFLRCDNALNFGRGSAIDGDLRVEVK